MRRVWLGAGFGFVALVVYLSLTPDPLQVPTVDDVKAGHFAAYAWLMLWFGQLRLRWKQRLGVAAALVLLGVALEYVQGMTSYRHFAYSDMRDNALGVAAGLALSLTPLGRVLERLEAFLTHRRS